MQKNDVSSSNSYFPETPAAKRPKTTNKKDRLAFAYAREKRAIERGLEQMKYELQRLENLENEYRQVNLSGYKSRYERRLLDIKSAVNRHIQKQIDKLRRIDQRLSALGIIPENQSNENSESSGTPFTRLINSLNNEFRSEKRPVVFPYAQSPTPRTPVPEMWSPTVARHSLPPGYGKRPEFERLPNPFSEANRIAAKKKLNSKNWSRNYALVTEGLPPYEEPAEQTTGNKSESASVKSESNEKIRGNSNSENRRSRYNDWGLCAEYLKNFSGLTPHDGGVVLLGDTVTVKFPEDFKMLPIATITDIKDPSKIKYIFDGKAKDKNDFSEFNSSLPELPDTLRTLILYHFKGPLPKPLPEGLQNLYLYSFKSTYLRPTIPSYIFFTYENPLPPLPEGLQILWLPQFNGTLPTLPAGLQTLVLYKFNGTLPTLPEGLQTLYLSQFNGTLPTLPEGLRRLHLSQFNGTLPTLPSTLVKIYAPKLGYY
jgi:hypothetical protein